MQRVIIALICVFFVLFSLSPTIYETVNKGRLPAERQFELVHNFPTDYNFYLSRIRQGLEGRTSVIERHTGEDHAGSYIQVFYLALGWAGRLWHVPEGQVSDVYHVARIVLGFTLLVLIWQFVKRAFPLEKQSHSGKQFFGDVRQSDAKLSRTSHASLNETSPPKRNGLFKFIFRRSFSAPQNSFPRDSLVQTHLKSFRLSHWQLVIPVSLVTFLLAITASTWPKLVFSQGGWRFGGYMPWWSLMDSLQRITFIPHLLAGQTLIIGLLLMLTHTRVLYDGRMWVLVGLLGFILGIIFPPGLLFVFAVLGVLTVMETVFERKVDTARIVCYGVFFFLSVPSLLYLQLMTTFYPWKRLVEVDIIRPLPFDYIEYFKAVGPMLPLGLLGLFVVFMKKEKAMFLSVSWVMAWLFLLFAFKFVPQQSPLRFSEMIPQVPLAVLAAYLFFIIGKSAYHSSHFSSSRQGPDRFGVYQSKSAKAVTGLENTRHAALLPLIYFWRNFSAARNARLRDLLSFIIYHLSFIIPITLVVIGLGVMVSSYWWQRDFVDHKMRAGFPLVPTGSYVMYPLKDFITAIRFIEVTAPSESVIFSETTAGNYIPAYSSKKVYLGHDNTVKYEEKQGIARQFFSGNMKPDEALAFLRQNKLKYVFFGPQEKEDGGVADLSKVYPFLQSVYSNSYVAVYGIK